MRFITASRLFDGEKFLAPDTILVLDENNRLLNTVNSGEIEEQPIEKYEGIICPGFVNAHCHLELSHMKGVIEEKTGLINFAKGIISKRDSASAEQISEAVQKWDSFMFENGVVAVGDICNGTSTFPVKERSKIAYHSFIELIGLDPTGAAVILNRGKEIAARATESNIPWSFAPHAPYSVSLELMDLISEFNSRHISISSIHNQESAEENKFFLGEKSAFHDLYQFLNLNISYFRPTGKDSLQSYLPSLIANRKLILVHNTFSNAEDIDFAGTLHKDLFWCLCPNANLYIENRLPDVKLLMKKGVKICVGTDSLASNHSLSILGELNVLLRSIPELDLDSALKWATQNGAEALGINDKFGTFKKNGNCGINLLTFENRKLSFSQKLA